MRVGPYVSKREWLMLLLSALLAAAHSTSVQAHMTLEPARVTWWRGIIERDNGRSFCIPREKTGPEVEKAVTDHLGAPLPDELTDIEAVALLGEVFPCAGKASPQEPPILKSVKEMHSFQNKLVETVQRAGVVSKNPCPSATYRIQDRHVVYKQLLVDDAGNLVGGSWKQAVEQEGCGVSRLLNAMVQVDGTNDLTIYALLPGTTRTDPLLQKDSPQYAFAAVDEERGCKEFYVRDTEFVGFQGEPTEGNMGQPWQELWTVVTCNRIAQVLMHFAPNGTGTTIITKRSETRYLPLQAEK